MYPKKDKNGKIIFPGFPEFNPNLTPREIMDLGSFGGVYFRPIHSKVTNKNYKNLQNTYKFFKGLPEYKIGQPMEKEDTSINKYKVKVGTTLEFWEQMNWIREDAVYGWVHWYCNFYSGIRGPDDERQIKRWLSLAGPKGRFYKRLVNMITKAGTKFDNYAISPKIRQTLQHWAMQLTKKDYNLYKLV